PEQRPEEGDRERRGRRSRRRRNRGRGFPESKYASDIEEAPKAAETSAPRAAAAETEFPVLPGESLAKYSRPAQHNDEVESEPAVQDVEEHREPEVRARGAGASLLEEPEAPTVSVTEVELPSGRIVEIVESRREVNGAPEPILTPEAEAVEDIIAE